MTVQSNPYLSFRNTARPAMEFYQSVFGGELDTRTFGDFGAPTEDPERDLVMHSVLTAPQLLLMASDTPNRMDYTAGNNFALSLSGTDAAELTALWEGLSRGATIDNALEASPWGDTFGMLTDAFGVRWMVNITAS